MKKQRFAAFVLALILPAVGVARGDIVTYVLDPTQSSLTISGTYEGDPLQPQPGVPDSLTTSCTGTITAERDFSAGTLQITGASITAQTGDATTSSGQPVDYAFIRPAGSGTNETFQGTVLGFSLSLSSQAIGMLPGAFEVTQVVLTMTSGPVDYTREFEGLGTGTGGSLLMTGALALLPGDATLVAGSSVETLTLPINTDAPFQIPGPLGSTETLDIHFSGAIVGTSPVPEPASLAMLGIPALLLLHRNFKETP